MKARLTFLGLAASALGLLAGCGAKSDLYGADAEREVPEVVADEVDEPPVARCLDDELWTAPGRSIVLEAEGSDQEGTPDLLWTLVSAPGGSAAALHPLHAPHTTLAPDLLGDYAVRFTVTDSAGQTDSCTCVVHSVNNPPTALCPEDVHDTPTGVPVTLEGNGVDDGRIVGFAWSIRDQPDGAHPTLSPADAATTVFTPDLEGTYEIRFEVIDDLGYRGSCIVTVTVVGAPALECPGRRRLSGPTRRPLTIPAITVLSPEPVTWRWEVVSYPAESARPLPVPADAASPTFTPDKPGAYLLRATATNARGLSSSCDVGVDAAPSGPDAICPAGTCTVPLNPITLHGDGIDDGRIVAWRWELGGRPAGSSAEPPSPADAQDTIFMADIAGDYTLNLVVTDDEGNIGMCTFVVTAVPSEGLRVEMYWNPPDRSCDATPGPGCDPTDVDLHLLHPSAPHWFQDPDPGAPQLDCYYGNCNASSGMVLEWDALGADDNPRLDLDDVEGHGPENINIDTPVTGHVYTVGVHYYADDGFGPSQVYVKVYCASTTGECTSGPPVEFGPVELRVDNRDWSNNQFWRVATVRWDGVTCTVTSLANPDGAPNITTRAVVDSNR
jgi:hypothetical protein